MNIDQSIVRAFCRRRDLGEDELFSVKSKRVWETRFMVWLYLHCEAKKSANRIAKMFGVTRASVFYGIRAIKHHMKYRKEIRDEYHSIMKEIEGAFSDAPSENME